MSIDSYDLDKLRYLLRQLSKENERLKEILRKADIPFESQKGCSYLGFKKDYGKIASSFAAGSSFKIVTEVFCCIVGTGRAVFDI